MGDSSSSGVPEDVASDDTDALPDNPRQYGESMGARYQAEPSLDARVLEESIQATQHAADIEQEPRERARLLSNLGYRLDARFELKGTVDDLNGAISAFQRAAELKADDDSIQSERLHRLGIALHKRFRRIGEPDDINGATMAACRAIELMSDDDYQKPARLNNYGVFLCTRFEIFGELEDMRQAISAQCSAVKLTPEYHPNKPSYLNSLGNSFLARFNCFNDLEDLEQAISAHRRAVTLTPDDHPSKPPRLNNLGASLLARFGRTGELRDIEQAISLHRCAVELTPEKHPDKPLWLNNMGNSFLRRFERSGELEDIDEAVSAHHGAVEITPDGHPSKASRLNNLGGSLRTRFEHFGKLEDIEVAISAHYSAVELTPEDHLAKPSHLTSLGSSLRARFDRTGALDDLKKAILAHRSAVELTPDGHPATPSRFNNLGNSLLTRFEYAGELEDVASAISAFHCAVELSPEGLPEIPNWLNNLGNSLLMRFERTGELVDITGATSALHRAVDLTPNGHPDKPSRFSNLGNLLSRRFQRTGMLEDLEDSIAVYRRAVELTPDDRTHKSVMLSHLCGVLCVRFECTKDTGDIESAVTAGYRAIALLPDEHPSLVLCCNTLAQCLHARFEHTGNIEDIEKSISMFQETMQLIHDGDPRLLLVTRNLGSAQESLFGRTQKQADFDAAIQSFMAASLQPSGGATHRFESARRCLSMLSRHPSFGTTDSLLLAHSRVIAILPEIVWLGYDIHRRYEESSKLGEVVNAAVSAATAAGSLRQAVEWLEAGRTLIWTQVLSLRTPLDELRDSHPELADLLQSVQTRLQSSVYGVFAPDVNSLAGIAGITINSAADHHSKAVIEYDKLMKQIRACPGFEDFLRPKKLDALIPSLKLADGPFVFINVHNTRSDALALYPDGSITHIRLLGLTWYWAMRLRTLWVAELDSSGRRQRAPLFEPSPSSYSGTDELNRLLGLIWRLIVNPVLEALDISPCNASSKLLHRDANCTVKLSRFLRSTCEWIGGIIPNTLGQDRSSSSYSLPHITWCPTGPVTQLPLHAAGIYDKSSGPRAIDLIVSSYAPSLSAFQRSSKGLSKQYLELSTLIVVQSDTPDKTRLPGTVEEACLLQKVLSASRVRHDTLEDARATIASVSNVIGQYSWIHLACHGSQHPGDATQSAFALHDGALSLRALMGALGAENTELAFLSACQTAKGDENNPEEATHLAAGMLAVGFKGVVATMWSIGDEDAPVVVEAYYRKLLQQRSESRMVEKRSTGAAYALHDAVQVLRKEVGEKNVLKWAPFVHFGV